MDERKSKYIFRACCLAGLAIIVSGMTYIELYCGGKVSGVKKTMSASELYSDLEIEDAMDDVIKEFRHDFRGCTLTDLWYDESDTKEAAAEWAESYGAEQGIILYSNFDVDGSGASIGLNTNYTYTNWEWILVRNSSNDSWSLKTWGNC